MKSEATLFREFFLSLEENERHVTGTVLLPDDPEPDVWRRFDHRFGPPDVRGQRDSDCGSNGR